MIQNDPKKFRNDPKRPKTSKLGKSGIFYQLLFFKFWAQMPKFEHFWPKSINLLILTKFPMYPISKVLISNLSFVFKNVEPKSLNLGILGQRVLISNLNKILTGSCFEGADFKSDFRSRKFWNFITSLWSR